MHKNSPTRVSNLENFAEVIPPDSAKRGQGVGREEKEPTTAFRLFFIREIIPDRCLKKAKFFAETTYTERECIGSL
jgi:hypothetical protein